MNMLLSKVLRMACVNEGSHSLTCHSHKWNALSCLLSPATEHHDPFFDWYLFPIIQRVGG